MDIKTLKNCPHTVIVKSGDVWVCGKCGELVTDITLYK